MLLALAMGFCLGLAGGALCALVLLVFGLPPAWEVIMWAAICGFIGGAVSGWQPR